MNPNNKARTLLSQSVSQSVLTTSKKFFRSVIATPFAHVITSPFTCHCEAKPKQSHWQSNLSYFFSFLFLLLILSGCGSSDSGLLSTANIKDTTTGDSTDTGGTTSTADLTGKIRITSRVSIASGKPSSEVANATVYAIGQESSKTTTDSNGDFTLDIDPEKSGVILQKQNLSARHASTPPPKNQYGIVVIGNSKKYGKKFEITGNAGEKITPSSPIEITEAGSISGKVTLQGKTDNTGIMVYIPGTSFMALTDASGKFTISDVPEGTYLILRAEKDGYNYSALSNITVQSNKTTTAANQMLLVSTGAQGAIVLNIADSITTSRTVDVNISATSNAILMILASESSFQNVSWTTIQSYTTYTFTADGNDTLYIKFADANGLESAVYSDSIIVDTNPRVTLSSPLTTSSSSKPTLTWTASTLPNPKYHVQVSTDSTFGSILEEATNLTSTSYTLTNILSNAVTYYCRISIIDENGTEWNWSDTGQFTIDLGTVSAVQPSGTSSSPTTIAETRPTLDWSDSSLSGVKYRLQVSDSSTFTAILADTTVSVSTQILSSDIMTSPLQNGSTYYWRVAVIDSNNVQGSWSQTFGFKIDLSTVTLTSPSNSSVTNDTTPTFSWSANSNAVSYNLVLSINSDLSSPINKTGISGTSTDTNALTNTAGTIYYWAVTPVDTNGASGTRSDIYSFTLDTTAPTGSIVINNGDTSTTSSSVTLSLSAADSMGVTGYCPPTESSTTPSSTDTCWTSITSITNYSTTTSFTLSSGSGIKTIYVWFRDTAGNVLSANSNITATPSAPTGLTPVSAGNGQVIISWNSVSDATSYNIYWSTASGVKKTAPKYFVGGRFTLTGKITDATSPHTHTVYNGTTYYYVVTAINSYGESSESSEISARPAATVNPFKTGQTTSYATGDDGDLEKGTAWPSPRFTVGTGLEADCITDNLTGLKWVKNHSSTTMSWQDALDYANSLSLCGYTTWRLPNINELTSLTNAEQSDYPTWLNGQGFSNASSSSYWSSTTIASTTSWAWSFGMYDNSVYYSNKTNNNRVLPVIGWTNTATLSTGQTTCYDLSGNVITCTNTEQDGDMKMGAIWPSPRFTAVTGAEADCITDNLTGLMWVKSPDSTKRTWADALTYANDLSLCGHDDWRLPNKNEMGSLINYGQSDSATWLNTQGFSNVKAGYYWSSTTSAPSTGMASACNMGMGGDFYIDKTNSYFKPYVLPVRGGQ